MEEDLNKESSEPKGQETTVSPEQVAPESIIEPTNQVAPEKAASKKKIIIISCIVLFVLAAVCGIFFTLLGGATLFAVNPTETFNMAKNQTRINDVDMINSAIDQYIVNELYGDIGGIKIECLAGKPLPEMDVNDGDPIGSYEGGPILAVIDCISDYLTFPDGYDLSEYRWGVDDANNPTKLYVGVTQMDEEGGVIPEDYYKVYPY